MGMHTIFHKDKGLFEEQQEIYRKIDNHEIIDIENEELKFLFIRDSEIDILNSADEYRDAFRTSKRELDGQYTLDIITSKKECFQWLEDNAKFNTIFEYSEELLNKFWKEYPKGVINFD